MLTAFDIHTISKLSCSYKSSLISLLSNGPPFTLLCILITPFISILNYLSQWAFFQSPLMQKSQDFLITNCCTVFPFYFLYRDSMVGLGKLACKQFPAQRFWHSYSTLKHVIDTFVSRTLDRIAFANYISHYEIFSLFLGIIFLPHRISTFF